MRTAAYMGIKKKVLSKSNHVQKEQQNDSEKENCVVDVKVCIEAATILMKQAIKKNWRTCVKPVQREVYQVCQKNTSHIFYNMTTD